MSSSFLINAAIAHLNKKSSYVKEVEKEPQQLVESRSPELILLNEELSDKHRKIISNMRDTRFDIKREHDRVFGEGVKDQDIPYSREGEERVTSLNFNNIIKTGGWGNKHHDFVLRHLQQNGYHVTDYIGGYAKKIGDEKGREEKIGKILSKTNGDNQITPMMSNPKYKMKQNDDGTFSHARDSRGNKIVESEGKNLSVSQTFANDPIRAAKKDVRLVVTRSKEGVAGMSTGKGWRSCMNLDDGCNRHFVPKDVEHGTLTAYLVKKNDADFDSPVGRVNLKQFTSHDGHKIWRPEEAVYGAMPHTALHAIKNWSETQYPAKEDSIYSKNSELYNDDGKSTIINGNPNFGKIHKIILQQVGDIASAAEDRNENLKWGHEQEDVSSTVHTHIRSLPQELRNNLAIHHTLTNEDDLENKPSYDMTAENHIAEWANHQHIDTKSLSDEELKHHLNTAEESSSRGRFYDGKPLTNATEVHSKLINEALKRGDQGTKDKIISHLVNNYNHPDGKDWYNELNEDGDIPHLHEHTENSNLLHKIYHIGKEGEIPDLVTSMDDMSSNEQHAFAKKIGKHGDDDFIKEFTSHDYHKHVEDGEHHIINGFHQGMNERPDSEEMQHKLIGELNLGGGHAEHGALLNVDSPERAFWAHEYPSLAHEQGVEHPGNNELYSNVAYHTKHKSVHDALKNRHDTQTPEIRVAIKSNVHGLNRE